MSGAWQFPAGFRWGAVSCGLRRRGPDLALVTCAPAASAAAMFTTNRLQAAPVRLSRAHLTASRGKVRGLIVNSGNANCATGPQGERAARATAAGLARRLGCGAEEIMVCSTGVIGMPLRVEKILQALDGLVTRDDGAEAAARAILTTDTCMKLAATSFRDGARTFRVAGYAKGSGMIHPRMATTLGFLFTDAAVAPARLRALLRAAVEESFHRITVDGDTSTNDTVALLASGAAGRPGARGGRQLAAALAEVARSLAQQVVRDGEGAKRVITITVTGARRQRDADRAARAIAHSPLVKTAFAGADANWGRVLCAAGYSGADFNPERASISFAGLPVYRRGRALAFDETEARRRLDRPDVAVQLDLGAGRASSFMWTCDLTEGYIRINGSYRT